VSSRIAELDLQDVQDERGKQLIEPVTGLYLSDICTYM
jgi:hypothetical protein